VSSPIELMVSNFKQNADDAQRTNKLENKLALRSVVHGLPPAAAASAAHAISRRNLRWFTRFPVSIGLNT